MNPPTSLKFPIAICLTFFLSGCRPGTDNPDVKVPIGKDYERILFDEYRIFRANSSEIAIVDGSRKFLVGPSVVRYSHRNPFIFGEVAGSSRSAIDDVPGYFLMDAATGRIEKGLGQTEWMDMLRANGIEDAPNLRKP